MPWPAMGLAALALTGGAAGMALLGGSAPPNANTASVIPAAAVGSFVYLRGAMDADATEQTRDSR